MKIRFYRTNLLVLLVLLILSCKDDDDKIDQSKVIEVYGRQYELSTGVLWKNQPYETLDHDIYVYEDTYINSNGQEVTDVIEGYFGGTYRDQAGNFMLSLYEKGISYYEELDIVNGQGVCLTIHLVSPDIDNFVEGEYVYDESKKEKTFVAYLSSDYQSDSYEAIEPAVITDGKVTIKSEGGIYNIAFDFKTSFDGTIKGEYNGTVYNSDIKIRNFVEYENILWSGLMDTIFVYLESPTGVITQYVYMDEYYGNSFIYTEVGNPATTANASKNSDLALRWYEEEEEKYFYFESPIRMRSYLRHSNQYLFPCHTIYMKAPSSFTEEDFENLEENGINIEIKEELVKIPIDNFETCYVFFKTGNNLEGVIKVHDFIPIKYTSELRGDGQLRTAPINPRLVVDIKTPVKFGNTLLK